MQTIKLSSGILSNLVLYMKFGLVILWIYYLIIANFFNLLIEAYLLSLAIGVISFFIFRNTNYSKPDIQQNRDSSSQEKFRSEDYLKVFFI